MSTKEKVLLFLEQNRSSFVSGQELADRIGVSRVAVWKAINALKAEGYKIDSTTNKGYKLRAGNDILSAEVIRLYLQQPYQEKEIIVLDKVDSTNTYAKIVGMERANHGTIITANEQTKGRGRFGRTFFSNAGEGIYLSVLLKPEMALQEVSFSTILTVVAIVRALKKFTRQKLEVKWVNDIFVGGKKVCGILTELVSNVETQEIDFIVAGIGINFNTPKENFVSEIRDIAGSVYCAETDRNHVIAEIVNQLLPLFEDYSRDQIIEEYRSYQMLLGRKVFYFVGDKRHEGTARDILPDGALLLEEGDGTLRQLHSGEVSIRVSDYFAK